MLHCLLSEELGPVQSVVDAFLLEEYAMSANLFYLASLDHGNLVCILDGGQAVGNHNAGAALLGTVQSLLDNLMVVTDRRSHSHTPAYAALPTPHRGTYLLALCIKSGSGFIQEQDLGIPH